jgi:hypothetical protein
MPERVKLSATRKLKRSVPTNEARLLASVIVTEETK